MINDPIELEPLLSQYDPGRIVVGPLLNLSISSNFRYFYIAASGAKIYESIGLGFEAETDAASIRLDIIEKLKPRFKEVTTPGSHLEMAQAVHMLWPNEETASVLALAALEAKAHPPTVTGADNTIHDHGRGCTLWGGSGPELTDGVTEAPVTHVEDIASVLTSPDAGHSPAISAPSKLPDATASWPLNQDATQQQRRSRPNNDNIALAVLELKSLLGNVPAPSVEASGRSASSTFRFYVVASILAFLAAAIVLSSVRRVADEGGPSAVLPPLVSSIGTDDSRLTADVPTGSIASARTAKVDQKGPRPEQTPGMPASEPGSVKPAASSNAFVAADGSTSSRQMGKSGEPTSQEDPIKPPLAPSQSSRTASAAATTESPSMAKADGVASPPSPVLAMPPAPLQTRAERAQTESSLSDGPTTKPNEAAAQAQPASPKPDQAARQTEPGSAKSAPSPTWSPQAASAIDSSQAAAAAPSPTVSPIAKSDQAAPKAKPVTTAPSSPSPPSQLVGARDTSQATAVTAGPTTSRTAKDDQSAAQAEPLMLPSQSPKIANAQPATAPVAKSPRATRVDDDVIASFISRAQVFLKSGDFAAARLLLRRAADAGSANAALMLGETFDPVVMSELGAIGIEPDVTQAREWYQKAVDLGSDIAAQRLGKLAQTR